MSLRISRQHWDGLLNELDQARRQRHLLTYRALLERLQFPTPAMQTLAAALEHLAALDAKAEQPLRSSLVISQGASRLPRTGFSNVWSVWGGSAGRPMASPPRPGMHPKWCGCSSTVSGVRRGLKRLGAGVHAVDHVDAVARHILGMVLGL